MKLPLSWLRDWIALDATPEQVADLLTRRGFYVEGIETLGGSHPGVVVARVLEVTKHPNADKLTLCRVQAAGEPLSIVCGAPNVTPGMWAPLATVGTTLPGGVTIRRSKIRGEESQGMLCSPRELGLSDEHAGILDLAQFLNDHGDGAAGLVPGRPLDELMPPPDAVLEIEVPFNRPDGLGVVGLAREVAAGLGSPWTAAARDRLARRWSPTGVAFPVTLEDPEGCPSYAGQVVENVRVSPSPRWLVDRLAAAGQRSVNDLVDLTNLVLLELGQPLHAFDLSTLHGPEIRVRRARPGERIVTLDGRERALESEVLVIADRDRPVAVAGVMGGAETEIGERTTSLLLECAWFEPRRIRRGARALGLSTEASKRYERGVDPEIGGIAIARFLELLAQVQTGARSGASGHAHVALPPPPVVRVRRSRVRRLTGLDVELDAMSALLAPLGFDVQPRTADQLDAQVPSFRRDVTLEEDLVEEVARALGYDRIPEPPLETRGVHATRSARERGVTRARRAMLARGLDEAWTTTLVSEREALDTACLTGGGEADLVRLANPMSRESEVLRPNPVAGLLRAVAHNLRQGVRTIRLFEVGHGFTLPAGPVAAQPGEGLPPVEQRLMIAAVVTGPRWAHAHDRRPGLDDIDFFDAKGLWEAWMEEMRVDTPEWRSYAGPGWKPGASAEVVGATSRIGWAGTLGLPLLRSWEIEAPVHLFLGLLEPMFEAVEQLPAVALPGRFPPVSRDLAFFVPRAVTHRQLERALAGAGGPWLAAIELFDVYEGPQAPPGMKSLAFALRFQHPDRTLTEAEVQQSQDRMVAVAAKTLGGHLREQR
jgi:phenylalanyl-tRNA synthetase beta chain